MLVAHFARLTAASDRVAPRTFDPEALEYLQSLEWPGNVRELRNTVERLLILASGDSVQVEDVTRLVSGAPGPGGLGGDLLTAESFSQFKELAERAFILHKLREHDWNVSETARAVEMPRSNLYKKIERYGLVRDE